MANEQKDVDVTTFLQTLQAQFPVDQTYAVREELAAWHEGQTAQLGHSGATDNTFSTSRGHVRRHVGSIAAIVVLKVVLTATAAGAAGLAGLHATGLVDVVEIPSQLPVFGWGDDEPDNRNLEAGTAPLPDDVAVPVQVAVPVHADVEPLADVEPGDERERVASTPAADARTRGSANSNNNNPDKNSNNNNPDKNSNNNNPDKNSNNNNPDKNSNNKANKADKNTNTNSKSNKPVGPLPRDQFTKGPK